MSERKEFVDTTTIHGCTFWAFRGRVCILIIISFVPVGGSTNGEGMGWHIAE